MLREHPLSFWQFVNDAHGTAGWLKRVVSLGRQHLRRIRPLVDGRHSLPLFFACRRANHGRCPRPVPTVLPLPFTGHLEEIDVVVKRGTRASGGEISRGLFVLSLHQVQNLMPRVPAQQMLAMQRCLDRCSPENESLFSPSSLAKLPWRESAADSLGL